MVMSRSFQLSMFRVAMTARDGRPDAALVALLRRCVEVGGLDPLRAAAVPGARPADPEAAEAVVLRAVLEDPWPRAWRLHSSSLSRA